ncbi:MAG: response regulator [Clostridia bacterium]|nr:response regulator [Clostridia bacterium]
MSDKNNLDEKYIQQIMNNKRALILEIIFTCCIAIVVIVISITNLADQAEAYASDVKSDYNILMEEYVRLFDTAYHQVSEKIKENPSFEEMDAWLKSQDEPLSEAMGSDIYDGISFTYKGDFARSWSYGDYSDYDPTTRRWYQTAEEADGKTAIVAPYVTFLDSQVSDSEPYILLSIVKKYNDEIYVDYDIKTKEIKELMQERHPMYTGTRLLLYDPDGYILSSNNSDEFAHNVFEADDVISQNLCDMVDKASLKMDQMELKMVDGSIVYLYTSQDELGNTTCMMIPFWSVFIHDFLAITLLVIFMIYFVIHLYHRNKNSLREFKGRDERLTALSNAAFQERFYVDMENMSFYGNEKAHRLCPDDSYVSLYNVFKDRITDEVEISQFEDFISPEALRRSFSHMYKLKSHRFMLNWKKEDGNYQPSTIEVSRLASVIDGKETVGILCKDVSEDAAILKDALKQAESASQAKGDFMSRMSHEIRTPLNAVIGYLDIAKDEKEDTEKVAHCLEQSAIASRHLLSIINDVLDISSIESGRMKIAEDDFDLTQMVHSLTTIFYAQAKNKGVKFDVSIQGLTEEWVRGDSLRVNQIMLNLLSNAVKFTSEGQEVRLDIRQVGVHEEKVHMQFTVSDTGIGMSEEYKKRIFHPFEQESASTAKNYGGTGLGLSISYNLVKMMSGSIEVESVQGQGTKFTVLLAFGISKEKRVAHLTTESFSKLRALVVDDERNACEYIQKLLDRCGVKCDIVTSGKKAVRRVKNRLTTEYPYDFCIIDWNMAEMDGLETAKQIRDVCGSEIPIIIATSYDYSSIIDEARKAGVNKIISKPLFQSTLFDLLVNTYGKYEPAEEKRKEKRKVDFHGMHVLLAEDNEMNMEIALDILTKAGLKVTPAVNGKEALDAFVGSDPNEYDAILMDVQMPVMDGYEATRAIRKSEHPRAATIPVIAMTANAFTSDVTAALAAGMNDHIAKPISYEHLFDALSRLTGEKENESADRSIDNEPAK